MFNFEIPCCISYKLMMLIEYFCMFSCGCLDGRLRRQPILLKTCLFVLSLKSPTLVVSNLDCWCHPSDVSVLYGYVITFLNCDEVAGSLNELFNLFQRFNPNIFKKVDKKTGKSVQYCCVAIGSRDRSISIWFTSLKRPLVVVHDIFDDSVNIFPVTLQQQQQNLSCLVLTIRWFQVTIINF